MTSLFQNNSIMSEIYKGPAFIKAVRERYMDEHRLHYLYAHYVEWDADDLLPRGMKLGEHTVVWADRENVWSVPHFHSLASRKVDRGDRLDAWFQAAQGATKIGTILQLTLAGFSQEEGVQTSRKPSALVFSDEEHAIDPAGKPCPNVMPSLKALLLGSRSQRVVTM